MKQLQKELENRNKIIEYFFYADYLLMELEISQKENRNND